MYPDERGPEQGGAASLLLALFAGFPRAVWDVRRYPSNKKISVHELPCTEGQSSTTEIQQAEPTWRGWIRKELMKEARHDVLF